MLKTAITSTILNPYTGSWTMETCRHLLRRCTFGPSKAMIDQAFALGLEATLDLLFAVNPMPDPPLNYFEILNEDTGLIDPDVPFGETWVNAAPIIDETVIPVQSDRNKIMNARGKSLVAWNFLLPFQEGISIREKMVWFWHNHFVVGQTNNPHRVYNYNTLLRTHALGNFKQLTKEMTIDVSMLDYLSGKSNTKNSPNENYARELLELFTVGKGDLIADGDYSTFTEDDVVQMAKALTGWKINGLSDPLEDPLVSYFNPNAHSTDDKQLSYHFNDEIITDAGELEYANLIDVIFQQDNCALFISRKLYRWFVHYEISPAVETDVIIPLAQIIIDNNYEIALALRALVSSECFFSQVSCMIKSPIDYTFSTGQGLNLDPDSVDLFLKYNYGFMLSRMSAELGQGIFDHPNVAGWKAYYQEPQFYRNWINSVTYPKRNEYSAILVNGGKIRTDNGNFNIDPIVPVLDLAAAIPNASDPNALIFGLTEQLFAYQISEEQKDYLKDFLISGLPDFEWTFEYNSYLADTTDAVVEQAIALKLRSLFAAMLDMPEFQIM